MRPFFSLFRRNDTPRYSNSKLTNYSLFTVLISTTFTAASPLIAVFIDGLFTSNLLGNAAFNAVNLILPISNLVMVLTLICNMGGSMFAAKSIAVGDHETQNRYFTASLGASVIVALMAIAYIALRIDAISTNLSHDVEVSACVKEYLRVLLGYFVFLPFATTFNNMVQLEGYPNLTTRITLASNIVNIILDFVFVALLNWGLSGIALATVVSGFLNAVLYIPHFLNGRSTFRISRLGLKDARMFKDIFFHGIGFNIFYIMTNLLLILTNSLVMHKIGSDGILMYGVCTQIQSVTFCFVVGMNIGGIAMITALNGEHDVNATRHVFNRISFTNGAFYFVILLIMAFIPTLVASCFGIKDPSVLSQCRYPFICFFIYYLCFAIIAVHTTLAYQLNGHIGAKAFFVFGLGAVVYLLMLVFSLFSVRLMWLAFPIGGVLMLLATLSFGFRRHLKDSSLTCFSLFSRYPDDVRVECAVDYAGNAIPEMMHKLSVFQDVCELQPETKNGIELCVQEFCDAVITRRPPLFSPVFNVSFSYRADEFVMTIKSPGAPFCMKLEPEEMKKLKEGDGDVSAEEIRELIINGFPSGVSYNYRFGLNVTHLRWKLR